MAHASRAVFAKLEKRIEMEQAKSIQAFGAEAGAGGPDVCWWPSIAAQMVGGRPNVPAALEELSRRDDRHGVYDRKALVKKLGAHTEFLEIPAILAVDYDRWGTDQCEAMFPCLLSSSLSFNGGRE